MSTFAIETIPTTGGTLVIRDMVWADALNLWVAVGEGPAGLARFATSPTGVTWTLRNAPEVNNYQGVCYSPTAGVGSTPLLVAVSTNGTNRVATSPDGITWTPRAAAAVAGWKSVTWSTVNSKFVAVASSAAMYSSDGITWASGTGVPVKGWASVKESSSLGLLVAVAATSGTASIMKSSNGIAWTSSGITHPSVAFFGGSVGGSGIIAWNPTLALFAAAARTNLPIAGNYQIITSPDALTWTAQTMPAGANDATLWGAVVATSGGFATVSNASGFGTGHNCFATSTNGTSWTTEDLAGAIGISYTFDVLAYSSTLNQALISDQGAHDVVIAATSLPATAHISPTSGNPGGGDTITIFGDGSNGGFKAGCIVVIYPQTFNPTLNWNGLYPSTITPASDVITPVTSGAGVPDIATSVNVTSATSLTCVTPTGKGVGDILVLNPISGVTPNVAFYLASAFTWNNPTISSITPTSGVNYDPKVITVTGSNLFLPSAFGQSKNLIILRDPTTLTEWAYVESAAFVNSTTLTFTIPPHPPSAPAALSVGLFAVNYSPNLLHYAYAYSFDGTYTWTAPVWQLGLDEDNSLTSIAELNDKGEVDSTGGTASNDGSNDPTGSAGTGSTKGISPLDDDGGLDIFTDGLDPPDELIFILPPDLDLDDLTTCDEIGLTPSSLPNSSEGEPYLAAISVSRATPPYTFYPLGLLPAGLSLDSLGIISGIAADSAALNLVILVVDANGCVGWRTYTSKGGPASDDPDLPPITYVPPGIIDLPPGTIFKWKPVPHITYPRDKGWWLSANDSFAGEAYLVIHSRPKDSRTFTELASFSTTAAGTAAMGGFPGSAAVLDNHLIYAPGGYTVGTDLPTLRIFDGSFDRLLVTIPKTSGGVIPKSILSTLAANGTIYLSTIDSGSSSSDWSGRVFSLDISAGVLAPIGPTFTTGYLPYALAWHMGRLWVGSHRQSSTGLGKISYFRPLIDTVWTDDTTLTSNCTSLLSYKGLLYAGTTGAAATFAKIVVRSAASGTWSTSLTATGGSAAANNAFLTLAEFSGILYSSYFNPDTVAVSKIYSFDNTSWTTSYLGSGTTNIPFVALPVDQSTLLALGGGLGYQAALIGTTNGTSWTNRTSYLPQDSPVSCGVPAFGVVVR